MAPIATLVRCNTDTAMEQKYSNAFATKEVMDNSEPNNEVDASRPSAPESQTETVSVTGREAARKIISTAREK